MSLGTADQPADRHDRILAAVIDILARDGISGVSMRSVAKAAGVSLGLVNYHFEDKTNLIRAALLWVEEHDLALVSPDPDLPPRARLIAALRHFAEPEFLTTEYLSLRLQLWGLASAHEDFARINADAQRNYRAGLSRLIQDARPDLTRAECNQRAADIDVLQNGVWLTALLGLDKASIRRNIRHCEEIALGDAH